jgi:hypothetical protein
MSVRRSAFQDFVQWPEKFYSFRLDYYSDVGQSDNISLAHVNSVLRVHVEALRSSTLYGPFRCCPDVALNLSQSTALEILTVSSCLLGELSDFCPKDARNLAPNQD